MDIQITMVGSVDVSVFPAGRCKIEADGRDLGEFDFAVGMQSDFGGSNVDDKVVVVLYDKEGNIDYDKTDFSYLAPAGLAGADLENWLEEFNADGFHVLTWHPDVKCYHGEVRRLHNENAGGGR